jgi:uncharacterized protein YrrD
MTTLLRATALVGRPVVTLAGESPFEIKDVLFDTGTGHIRGFTLRKHGFLGGPAKERLRWTDVHGLGPDAVVIRDTASLTDADDNTPSRDGDGDVIGDRILTESGDDLGEVVEAVVATGTSAEVVGFEIEATPGTRPGDQHHVFVPLPAAIAISGDMIVVPDSAVDYIRDDLSGFGSAVEEFRSMLTAKDD